jgi:two-component system LytT family response regulator
MIRTLIVDDEPLARLNLAGLLETEHDFAVCGECADGAAAARAIAELHPDLVLLDVQMPAMDGLVVLDRLAPDCRPAIVFVTAHEQFAVRAFEADAVDYLLKPFHRERFRAALDRVRRALMRRREAPAGGGGEPTSLAADRMIVSVRGRLVLVPYDELTYVRAAANYVQLHLHDRTYDVREKISTMQARLPSGRFLRIHRSYLVNLREVQEMYAVGGGDYMISLRNGKQLPVGPSYPESIRRALARTMPYFGGGVPGTEIP